MNIQQFTKEVFGEFDKNENFYFYDGCGGRDWDVRDELKTFISQTLKKQAEQLKAEMVPEEKHESWGDSPEDVERILEWNDCRQQTLERFDNYLDNGYDDFKRRSSR